MDDLIEHIKSLHDSDCEHLRTPYLEYMQQHYTYKGLKGLQSMTDQYPEEELLPWCQTLINLFYARPYSTEVTKLQDKKLVNNFSHVVQGLMALDDAEWRPVALAAMRKSDACRSGNHKVGD